jgi:hypothetical protein
VAKLITSVKLGVLVPWEQSHLHKMILVKTVLQIWTTTLMKKLVHQRMVGVTCDGSLLGNESQTDSLTADIAFSAVQARHNKDFKCEKPELVFEECTLPTQKFATAVVSSSQGVRKDGTPVIAGRTNPTLLLERHKVLELHLIVQWYQIVSSV